MPTTLMDYADIAQRPTRPVAAIPLYDRYTARLPATLSIARPLRPMLAIWLHERCSANGGVYYGSLDLLQWESGISFSIEDIRTLARYGYIAEPLICDDGECIPYLFVIWERAR